MKRLSLAYFCERKIVDYANIVRRIQKLSGRGTILKYRRYFDLTRIFVVRCKQDGSGVLVQGQRRFRNCSSHTPGEYFSLNIRWLGL
ncbi:hypothetical protein [Azospirillum palustre]